jgi:hypothetical protein
VLRQAGKAVSLTPAGDGTAYGRRGGKRSSNSTPRGASSMEAELNAFAMSGDVRGATHSKAKDSLEDSMESVGSVLRAGAGASAAGGAVRHGRRSVVVSTPTVVVDTLGAEPSGRAIDSPRDSRESRYHQ